MSNGTPRIKQAESVEHLRQQAETFDQRKNHDKMWFYLRLTFGYSSVVLLTAILIVASVIIFNYKNFPDHVVLSASTALFVDAMGLAVLIWKGVIRNDTPLAPVTDSK